MSDFSRFVEVDARDNNQDVNLQKIDNSTVFEKGQLRKYLANYMPERICWTGIGPIFNDTLERDTHRYYWSSKMAKDFVMLTGKDSFTYHEVESYFKDRAILNYLNEMILEAIDTFESLLIRRGRIKEVYFDEHFSNELRDLPILRRVRRLSKFINMDSIFY